MSRPTTFILSYERPLYLWAALDSLYRATKSEMRFILVDSGSADPLVHSVIDGFDRRGMFDTVVRLPVNDTEWVEPFFEKHLREVGDVFFYVESDVIVEAAADCWAERMLGVMRRSPKLAMLGSKIDPTDFIDPAALAKRLGRELTADERLQIKAKSLERTLPAFGPDEVISPFNPPGRLLALRTQAVQQHLVHADQWRDSVMHKLFTQNGWTTGIYGGVVHRHLSLCNYWDYGDYSMAKREQYMSTGNRPAPR
jgi:hypothetical protein